jgi:hypothetical protein
MKQIKKKRGNNGSKLTFRWSAGHVGIKGNEDADKEAKAAADGDNSDKAELPSYLRKQLKFSITAAKQAHNSSLKIRWGAEWAKSPRYRRLRFQDVLTPSSQKYIKNISGKELSRNSASRIFQLRTGHVPLHQYLHRFKRVDTPQCPACGHPRETVEHYLLYCPKYDHERWPIISKAGGSRPKLNELLSKTDFIQPLANYIEATERFSQAAANYTVRDTQT